MRNFVKFESKFANFINETALCTRQIGHFFISFGNVLEFFGLILDNLPFLVSLNIDIVNPTPIFPRQIFSVCEHGFLDQGFVPFIDLIKNKYSPLMLHYLFEGVFSHGESLHPVDWLVQVFRALVVKGAVVIDCASNVLFLVHNDFGPVEDLVEKSVADTHTSFCYHHTFKNFFVLVLNKLIF